MAMSSVLGESRNTVSAQSSRNPLMRSILFRAAVTPRICGNMSDVFILTPQPLRTLTVTARTLPASSVPEFVV